MKNLKKEKIMKENFKIALDFVEGAIEEVDDLIKLFKKSTITNKELNEKLEIISSKYLINILAYVLIE